MKPRPQKNGYLIVGLRNNGNKQHMRYVHILVCRAFHGPKPEVGHEVAHKDGKRDNNLASNLLWKTHVDNLSDMIGHGTRRYGERNHNCRLDDDGVRSVFALRQEGLLQKDIGARLGVSQAYVSLVLRGEARKTVVGRYGNALAQE